VDGVIISGLVARRRRRWRWRKSRGSKKMDISRD